MSDSYKTRAISFRATKEAALYFDHVIPLALVSETAADAVDKGDEVSLPELLQEILPEELKHSKAFHQCLIDVQLVTSHAWLGPALVAHGTDPGWLGPAESLDLHGTFEHRWSELSKHFDQSECVIVSPARLLGDDGPVSDLVVSINNLRLIDSSMVSWRQLTEFRRDPQARRQLRRLRLFAVEHYRDRSRSFIEDDLLQRITDYDAQVKAWGFDTTHSTLAMVLSSKWLASGLGGTILAAFFGAPALAIASAIAATSLEVGQVAVELSRRRLALRRALQENPVSYLVRARDNLSP